MAMFSVSKAERTGAEGRKSQFRVRKTWPSSDWLNTNAQMYSPDPDHPEPAWEVFIERSGVVIEVATAPFLLAMKLHAARGLRDTDDIEGLVARSKGGWGC